MKKATLFLLLLCMLTEAHAQRRLIKGQVRDESLEPLIGASIIVKNESPFNGAITDLDGNFELWVNDDDIMVVSYIGCIPQDILVGSRSSFIIDLKEDYQDLGLPSVYYIRSTVSASSLGTYSHRKAGYAFDVQCTLPYHWSDRYNMGLYNKSKQRLAVGWSLMRVYPSRPDVKTGLYLRGNLSELLYNFNRRNRFSFHPYVQVGMYLDVIHKNIKSRSFGYGGGFRFHYAKIPYLSLHTGYQAFDHRTSFNHFFLGICLTFPLTPIIYY